MPEEKPQIRLLWVWLSLAGMITFAILLSVFIFAKTSITLDEAQSLFQTNRNVSGMLYLVAQDVHVPFFHLLLHFWQLLFGNTIFIARMMSLLFFIGTIIVTYYLGAMAFGRRSIGLFAAFLLTISPFMQWYGSDARMYSMLAFFVVLHQVFFVKLMKGSKPVYWVWFTLTGVMGIYTHYFFAFVLLTEAIVYFMLRRRFPSRHSLLKFIVSSFIIVGSLLPWLLYVYHLGFASNDQPLLAEPTAVDLFGTYMQFLFGFQNNAVNTIVVSMWPILVLLAFFALRRRGHKLAGEAIVFIMVATIPVLAAFIISIVVKPLYISRYLIVSLPALMLFISWLLYSYRPQVAVFVRFTLVGLIAILLTVQVLNPQAPVKEDYSGAVGYLNQHASASDVIVLSAPFTIYPVEYYYHGSAHITTQPIWDRFTQGSVPAFNKAALPVQTQQTVGSYEHAWVLLSYDQGYNTAIQKYYQGHYQQLFSKTYSDGMTLYEFQIRYNPVVTATK